MGITGVLFPFSMVLFLSGMFLKKRKKSDFHGRVTDRKEEKSWLWAMLYHSTQNETVLLSKAIVFRQVHRGSAYTKPVVMKRLRHKEEI